MLKKNLPTPITVLMIVILVAAIATWTLPSGKYNTLSYENNAFVVRTTNSSAQLPATQKTLDSLDILITLDKFQSGSITKAVSIPGTYKSVPQNRQGIIDIIEAPIKGILDSIDIILFVLFIGGFMNVFYQTGAMEKGLIYLSH